MTYTIYVPLFLFFFYMALPNGRRVWELRTDTDLIVYRWTGSAWIVNGSGTPSSSTFPDGRYAGEIREDRTTGRFYRWSGSAWVLQANSADADQDGVPDRAELADLATDLVGGNGTTLKGSVPYQNAANDTVMLAPNVTTTKKFLRETGDGTNGTAPAWDTIVEADVPAASVGTGKLKYTVETVEVSASTTGTATVTSGAQILGFHVTAITGAEHVKTIAIAATTLTVTLTGSDTATIQVIVLEPQAA